MNMQEKVELFYLDGPLRGVSKWELMENISSNRFKYIHLLPYSLGTSAVEGTTNTYECKALVVNYIVHPVPPSIEGHRRFVLFMERPQ